MQEVEKKVKSLINIGNRINRKSGILKYLYECQAVLGITPTSSYPAASSSTSSTMPSKKEQLALLIEFEELYSSSLNHLIAETKAVKNSDGTIDEEKLARLLNNEFLNNQRAHDFAVSLTYRTIRGLEKLNEKIENKITSLINETSMFLQLQNWSNELKINLLSYLNKQSNQNNLDGLKRIKSIFELLLTLESDDFYPQLEQSKPVLMELPFKAKYEWISDARRLVESDITDSSDFRQQQLDQLIQAFQVISTTLYFTVAMSPMIKNAYDNSARLLLDAALYLKHQFDIAEKKLIWQMKNLDEILKSGCSDNGDDFLKLSLPKDNWVNRNFLPKLSIGLFSQSSSKISQEVTMIAGILEQLEQEHKSYIGEKSQLNIARSSN